MDLLAAGRLHLFAHDSLDLSQHPEAKRQPRVDSGGRAADVPRPHEKPVAGNFGVGRIFTQRTNEKRRHSKHGYKHTGRPAEAVESDGPRPFFAASAASPLPRFSPRPGAAGRARHSAAPCLGPRPHGYMYIVVHSPTASKPTLR